jgi:hypothetical protein
MCFQLTGEALVRTFLSHRARCGEPPGCRHVVLLHLPTVFVNGNPSLYKMDGNGSQAKKDTIFAGRNPDEQ